MKSPDVLLSKAPISASRIPRPFVVPLALLTAVWASAPVHGIGTWKSPAAAAPVLVRDFSAASWERAPGVARLARFGSLLAMAARDEAHGEEPYLTDGTVAGTRRLADIAPGPTGSAPRRFLDLGGGRLLFIADDAYRSHLFAYSGGLEGGQLGLLASDVQEAAAVGSTAFFFVQTANYGLKLYQTDGSAAGTSLVADLCLPGAFCSTFLGNIFVFGDSLYYQRASLWYRLRAGSPPEVVRPLEYVFEYLPLDGTRFVMVAADQAIDGLKLLWVSDGTTNGTFKLERPGNSFSLGAHDLVAANGRIYALDHEGTVISADGTPEGTRFESGFPVGYKNLLGGTPAGLLYSVYPGSGQDGKLRILRPDGIHDTLATTSAYPDRVALLPGQVLFRAGEDLWRSDGTTGGTGIVGSGLQAPLDSTSAEIRGFYYFPAVAAGQVGPPGLYRVKTTGPAEEAVATLSEPIGSYPRSFPVGDLVVAAARIPEANEGDDDSVMWRIAPETFAATQAEPRPLKPLASNGEVLYTQYPGLDTAGAVVAIGETTATELGVAGQAGDWALDAGGALLFGDQRLGESLWKADLDSGSVFVTADLAAGTNYPDYCGIFGPCTEDFLPARLTASGDNVFFVADSHLPSSTGLELFVRRGDAAPTFLANLPGVDLPEYFPNLVALPGGRVAVLATADDHLHLYVSDGTPAGTRLLSTELYSLFAPTGAFLNGRLIVAAYPGVWSFDPDTGERLQLVTADWVYPFTVSGDRAFFLARLEDTGYELWSVDGLSEAETRMVDLRPGPRSALGPDLEIHSLGDGRVVFAADDGSHGNELFVSDGDPQGTFRLTDLAPGAAAANPRHFHHRGDRLFFAADDGVHGSELWALDLPQPLPPCPANRLCLLGGRFEAEVTATTANGQSFVAQRALASSESGVLSFFSPDNWEMMVKLLDGCAINQRFWVFASAASDVGYELRLRDRATGELEIYRHEAGSPAVPVIDLGAFAGCGAAPPEPAFSTFLPTPPPAHTCPGDAASLCLGAGGRFRVRATWTTAASEGVASPVPYGSLDSGLFTFFSPENWELLVKVLDGCALNGKHWIYAAGTTDVGWRLEVEDLVTHQTRVYQNPLGQPSLTVTDSQALDGCN